MLNMKHKNKKGFTLIELLIVISIIVLLSGISIFALQGARTSGRDARRKADLENVMSAMILYKADCGQYPSSVTFGSALTSSSGSDGCTENNTYMAEVPNDPLSSQTYCYNKISNTQACLCADLENDPDTSSTCASCTCDYRILSP